MSLSAVAEYKSFKVQFKTSKGVKFWAVIDENGIEFYDHVSSSGSPEGKPIKKSADNLFDWIGKEGDQKHFSERSAIKRQQSKS